MKVTELFEAYPADKTFDVLFGYDDPSGKGIASHTIRIKNVNDKEHAKRVFGLEQGKKYKNFKIKRVTEVKPKLKEDTVLEADDDAKKAEKAMQKRRDKVWQAWWKILENAEDELQANKGEDTSHAIGRSSYGMGGQLRASSSGNVKLVSNYTVHGSYNMSTTWNKLLQVGSNIQGKKALDEVQRIFNEMKAAAKKIKGVEIKEHGSGFTADGLVAGYDYGSNFSWVAFRSART